MCNQSNASVVINMNIDKMIEQESLEHVQLLKLFLHIIEIIIMNELEKLLAATGGAVSEYTTT